MPAVGVVAIRPLLREAVGLLARPGGAQGERRTRLEAVFLDEVADLRPEARLVVLPGDGPARAVADELLADPAEARSLDELGRAVGASSRTLQRRFRAETGLTFQQWRRRARVQSSMGHLADGASVTTVAHRCGFSSASAFIAAFRAETGHDPDGLARAARLSRAAGSRRSARRSAPGLRSTDRTGSVDRCVTRREPSRRLGRSAQTRAIPRKIRTSSCAGLRSGP